MPQPNAAERGMGARTRMKMPEPHAGMNPGVQPGGPVAPAQVNVLVIQAECRIEAAQPSELRRPQQHAGAEYPVCAMRRVGARAAHHAPAVEGGLPRPAVGQQAAGQQKRQARELPEALLHRAVQVQQPAAQHADAGTCVQEGDGLREQPVSVFGVGIQHQQVSSACLSRRPVDVGGKSSGICVVQHGCVQAGQHRAGTAAAQVV